MTFVQCQFKYFFHLTLSFKENNLCILRSCSSNISSKRDSYVLRFPINDISYVILLPSQSHSNLNRKIIKIANIITKFLKGQRIRHVIGSVLLFFSAPLFYWYRNVVRTDKGGQGGQDLFCAHHKSVSLNLQKFRNNFCNLDNFFNCNFYVKKKITV